MSLFGSNDRPIVRGLGGFLRPLVPMVGLAAFLADTANSQLAANAAPATNASARSWVHESWTVKDGLPVNSVGSIIQDHTGYIWLATFDGLVRFDGVRFTVFNSANSDELPSNRIIGLKEARDGTLWLSTEQGHVVRFRDGRFTNVAFDRGGPSGYVVTLFEDSSGAIWAGDAHGLWRFERDRLVRVGKGTLDARVSSIVQRKDGSIWAGTSARGIYRATSDGRVAKMPSGSDLEADDIWHMVVDASGTLWVQGFRALWSWREHGQPAKVKVARQPFHAETVVEVQATGAIYVASAPTLYRIDADSLVPVGSSRGDGGRLWADSAAIWSVDGGRVYRDGRLVFTLPERRTVSSILFDREGSLWLGTDAGGLHLLKPALFTTYSLAEGVSHSNVYATFVDRAGTIWLGTWGKGASRIDPGADRAVAQTSPSIPEFVNSFFEDALGQLWIGGGSAGGLHVCARPALTCRPEGPSEIRHLAVFALFGDNAGGMWVGADGMLLRYDGHAWKTFAPSSGAPAATVRAFANMPDGSIWMGTNGGGIARYHDGVFTRVTRANGLPSDLIRSLYRDADGWLWVGTEGRGLARLDPRVTKPTIVRIGTKDGLFDEVIHQILEDDSGRLWMNTNRGVFWVARPELNAFADGKIARIHSTAYSERDGMGNREGNGGVQPAGAKARDGRLWFPTQDGVVVVDPAKVGRAGRAPPLVVEQVVARGTALHSEHDSVALRPNERDVQIEYTALTFVGPTNVRFRYRLDPYDAAWVDVGNRRTAFYTKVPPGRYTFRVQASDAAGGWYEPGVNLAVRVMPTIWETNGFRWLLAAAFIALLFVAVRLREARLRGHALQLERIVDERTAALRDQERLLADQNARLQSLDQAKTRFFANVSHELRTPLTLTIGPLEDLRARAGGDPQVERWLDIALRNSRRLLRLVNQILDVSKLDAGAMPLAPRPLDLVPFTRGIVGAFAPVAERKGIELAAEAPESLRGSFDADAFEKILTNLLSNAIKFTPSGGAVRLVLSNEGGSARLSVRDSGPGIPTDQLAHIFERFYQVDESATRTQPGTGIGLSLVKELVELHGGSIVVDSGSAGTTFAAMIPPRAPVDGISVVKAAEAASPVTVSHAEEHNGSGVTAGGDAHSEDVPTLLVVDDSADLRRYIRDHFAAQFRVLEAADGAEGIALARQHVPDVIVSDVMMPGTDGHELVRALRESPETSFLAIVLLTAQADDQQKIEGLERGADDYIVKPFEMRELDARVRNLMLSRRRLRAHFATRSETAEPRAADPGVAPIDRAYMQKVREAIRNGLSNPEFGVGELAHAVSQDRSHLFRRVKQLFGESPSDLIWRMRIDEGERLLADGSATVSDVAYAVGFNSLSHFCRRFREAHGVTPATYRNRASVPSD
jgi:signal transduction histidine kinase/ligand-binding sensor domain-containing protein/DNA-binding response OmpR family regulator